MKSVIIKVFVIVGLFFGADFVLGTVIGHFYGKSKNINLRDANYGFLGNAQDDILIFGASELSHALISNTIADTTHLTTYNLACDACGIYYQYPLLETILEKHVPKVIILSSNQMNEEDFRYIDKMYPFYGKNGYVKQIVDELHPEEYMKLALQGYVYNSKLIRVFDSKNDNLNGYVPLTPGKSKIDPSDIEVLPDGKNAPITGDTKNYFRKFVEKATSKGVRVYVCAPPVLQEINEAYWAKNDGDGRGVRCKTHRFFKGPDLFGKCGSFFR